MFGLFLNRSQLSNSINLKNTIQEDGRNPEQEMRFDSTGMFHWCAEQKLTDCIIVCTV